jgi:hypothetical protein
MVKGSRSQSVRRWWEHRRALVAVSPGELVELQKRGTVSESLKHCAALAQEEALALTSALGGVDALSEQRLILIQDTARLGLVLRAVMARFLQGDGDPELASRVASITGARRASLQALGLERASREIDLAEYLKRKDAEDRVSDTNGDDHDTSSVQATSAPPARDGGGAGGTLAPRAAAIGRKLDREAESDDEAAAEGSEGGTAHYLRG